MSTVAVNVEEALPRTRYKVDHGRPHIRSASRTLCRNECRASPAPTLLPGLLLQVRGNGAVTLITDSCLRMRQLPDHLHRALQRGVGIPRGGHGILFKFG